MDGMSESTLEHLAAETDKANTVSRPGYTSIRPEEILASLRAFEHRLHAARYAFHKVRCKVYGDAVEMGQMTAEQGREMYRLAMLNYDELIKSSASGSVTDADDADMAKGFPL